MFFARGLRRAGHLKAEQLAVELDGLPPDQRWALARHDPRYRDRALFELLLRRSRESAGHPRRAESLAELAVAVVQNLCSRGDPALAYEDLQTAAWGTLAGARRLLLDFTGAEEALAAARQHLALGTEDRLEKAWLLDLEASLREAQGRIAEASRLRGRAEALYRGLE